MANAVMLLLYLLNNKMLLIFHSTTLILVPIFSTFSYLCFSANLMFEFILSLVLLQDVYIRRW